tara:strand:- start:200 stop:577 length:378 start_codon:yes stop_codon:yes gene_type:complete
MRDRWQVWQYRDDANCWDFVRAMLINEAGINPAVLPVFGVLPDDKRGMTKAHHVVRGAFRAVNTPATFDVACQYRGKCLIHVGIVIDGAIWHVGRKTGFRIDHIPLFSQQRKVMFYRYGASDSTQ